MKFIYNRIYLFIWIFLFTFTFIIPAVSASEMAEGATTEIQKPAHYLVATYFHNSFRCPTCHRIEDLSAKSIQDNFSEELKRGTLVWRVINLDESGNQHYNKDYQLYTKSLIISEMKDGKEVRWKNLEKIWTYVGDDAKFEQYVTDEIKDWLKE